MIEKLNPTHATGSHWSNISPLTPMEKKLVDKIEEVNQLKTK